MAGIVSVPMAAQASTGDGAYSSVRIDIQSKDTAGNSEVTVRCYSSRFGFKSEADLSNGMTVAPSHNPWRDSGYKILQHGPHTDNGLTYMGTAGAISFGVTSYMSTNANDGTSNAAGAPENIDGTEMAVAYDAGFAGFALGVSARSGIAGAADAEDVTSISINSMSIGDATLGFNFQSQDVANTSRNNTSLTADITIASFYAHYEATDNDTAAGVSTAAQADPSSLTLGYSNSLGPQTTIWG